MNQNFLLFRDRCRVDQFKSIFFVTPRGKTLHQIIPPPSFLMCDQSQSQLNFGPNVILHIKYNNADPNLKQKCINIR